MAADIVRTACRQEIEALKPGNVSVYSAGHGMTADDFFLSAELVAPVLAQAGSTVGERILDSVQAVHNRLNNNINLGIVLLAAPLVSAAMLDSECTDLRSRVREVLNCLNKQDARLAFEAIRLASPGGLGHVEHHDVAAEPEVSLLEAMAFAQNRDRVAYQYAHAYEDIFTLGVLRLRKEAPTWVAEDQKSEWATVACYLGFLCTIPDSHIQRKFGWRTADRVCKDAEVVESKLKACENSKDAVKILLEYDNELKREGLNPGTSADLTVASLMALQLEDLLIGNLCSQYATK